MKSCQFKAVGKIRGKSRPRFNTRTGRAYSSNTDKIYENIIREAHRSSGGVRFDDDDYIRAEIDLYFAIPKSYSKKRRQNCLVGIEKCAKKPDIDNILKNIFDSGNGYIYKDDIQIVEVICRKHYTDADEDYIIVKMEEIK